MVDHFDWALKKARLDNQRPQLQKAQTEQAVTENEKQQVQQSEQQQPEPQQDQLATQQESGKAIDKEHPDWRRLVNEPEYRQELHEQRHEANQLHGDERQKSQQTSARSAPEKKIDEEEVDWRRLRTDPEYRREIQNRREAEQERTGEQENEHAHSRNLEQ